MELNVDEEGRGQGSVIVVAEVWFNKEHVLGMENLGNSCVEFRHR